MIRYKIQIRFREPGEEWMPFECGFHSRTDMSYDAIKQKSIDLIKRHHPETAVDGDWDFGVIDVVW